MLSYNPLPANTSPDAAVRIAYAWGAALRAAGADMMELSTALAEYINVPHAASPLKRQLRIGFSAGYLGLEMPETERVTARCKTEDARRKPRKPTEQKLYQR
jgi:hypothetical protein